MIYAVGAFILAVLGLCVVAYRSGRKSGSVESRLNQEEANAEAQKRKDSVKPVSSADAIDSLRKGKW